MIQNLSRTLRQVAGGGVLIALGVGAVGSQPPAMVATAAGTALPSSGPAVGVRTIAGLGLTEATAFREERATIRELRAANALAAATVVVSRPTAARTPSRARRAVAAPPAAVAIAAAPPTQVTDPVNAPPGNSAGYAFGYCTWWVSHKRLIPWHAMAYQWWSIARTYGFAEGPTPRVGAVMVMGAGQAGASASAGHVAYVEAVNPNGSFVISEMNWYGAGGGWGKVDYRTITSMAGILGFIY